MEKDVMVMIGSGGICIAIVHRFGFGFGFGFGKKILLSDFNPVALDRAKKEMEAAGYSVETQVVDVTSCGSVKALAEKAASLGNVMQVVNSAGLSSNIAPAEKILDVDLCGPAVVFEEFENVINMIISSMAGHMTPASPIEAQNALALTPADER
ncbi:MAG: hypothetical protein ACK5NL_04465 [Vibrio fluvialis]